MWWIISKKKKRAFCWVDACVTNRRHGRVTEYYITGVMNNKFNEENLTSVMARANVFPRQTMSQKLQKIHEKELKIKSILLLLLLPLCRPMFAHDHVFSPISHVHPYYFCHPRFRFFMAASQLAGPRPLWNTAVVSILLLFSPPSLRGLWADRHQTLPHKNLVYFGLYRWDLWGIAPNFPTWCVPIWQRFTKFMDLISG